MSVAKRRILVVDGDEKLRDELRQELTGLGYTITATGSAQRAQRWLSREDYHVVLLDWSLPDTDGQAFLAATSWMPNRPPIILMCDRAQAQDVTRARRAGAAEVVQKPVTPQQVSATIEKLLHAGENIDETKHNPDATEPSSPPATVTPDTSPTGTDRDFVRQLIAEMRTGQIKLPTPEPLMVELSQALDSPRYGIADMARAIEKHPLCSAKVLQLSRTPIYAARGGRDLGLRHAVQRLGMRTTANVVRTVLMRNSLVVRQGRWLSTATNMWNNSVGTATIARMLAVKTRSTEPELAYLAGLFHNVGESLMLRLSMEMERHGHEVPSPDDMVDEIGTHHASLGYILCKSWKLDDLICETARHHHHPELYESNGANQPLRMLCNVTVLSHHVAVDMQGAYLDRLPNYPDQELCREQLRLPESEVNEFRDESSEVVAEVQGILASG